MNFKKKDTYIIIRIDKESKNKLVALAGGVRKLSTYIRNVLERKIN